MSFLRRRRPPSSRLAVVLFASALLASSGCGLLLDTDPQATSDIDGGVVARDGARPMRDAEPLDAELVDATAPDAGPMRALRCGGPETLRDDFEDGAPDNLWIPFTTSPMRVRETSGALEVEPAAMVTAYGGYISRYAVDMRGSWFAVHVLDTAGDAVGLQTFMKLSTFDDSESSIIAHENGMLRLVGPGGMETSVGFDPTSQAWWRLREDAGTMHFETSADGWSWETLHALPATENVVALQMSLGAGTWAPVSSTGRAAFDDVNLDGPGGARMDFCAASSFADDFERSDLGPHWFPAESGCTVTHVGGEITFAGAPDTGGTCTLWTTTAYDMREDQVVLDLSPFYDPDAVLAFRFGIRDRGNGSAYLELANGTIHLDAGAGGPTMALPSDASFLRLFDGTTGIGGDHSGGGGTWSDVGIVTPYLDLSAVRVEATLYVATGLDTPHEVVVRAYGSP